MTQITANIWAYPIPDEAMQISVYQFKHSGRSIPYWHINWNYPKDHQYTSSGVCLFYKMLGGKKRYPTNLQFLFTTKTATEEDARKVVSKSTGGFAGHIKGYKDYEFSGMDAAPLDTAIKSLHSLLRSKGLDDKNNYAIIEKLSSDE